MEETFVGEEEKWFHCFHLKKCELIEDEYLKTVENKMRTHKTISYKATDHKSLTELKRESSNALTPAAL